MTSPALVQLSIQGLFPGCVATACCRIADADAKLDPEEHAGIKHAVAKRQQEFIAGRICARQALDRLGITAGPLRKLPDGSIAWPDSIMGTVSHSEIWCGAAVARRCDVTGIGLDIETVTRVGENLWRQILTKKSAPGSTGSLLQRLSNWWPSSSAPRRLSTSALLRCLRNELGLWMPSLSPICSGTLLL